MPPDIRPSVFFARAVRVADSALEGTPRGGEAQPEFKVVHLSVGGLEPDVLLLKGLQMTKKHCSLYLEVNIQ